MSRGGRAPTRADSRVRSTSPRRGDVRAAARPRRATSIAGDDAGIRAGHAPGNKGLRYPADPPKVEEIIAVMREAGENPHGRRLRGLIVILWRAGLRIQQALALTEAISIRAAARCWSGAARAGGRRREVGMDAWGWGELQPWLDRRRELPVGLLLCVINGATRGRHWSPAAAHADLRRTAAAAGVRRRFAPH